METMTSAEQPDYWGQLFEKPTRKSIQEVKTRFLEMYVLSPPSSIIVLANIDNSLPRLTLLASYATCMYYKEF